MNQLLNLYIISSALLLLGTVFFHALPRLGTTGKALAIWFCRAPGVDWAIAYFTLLAPIIGFSYRGISGMFVGFAAEYTAMILWIIGHELVHQDKWKGAKIHRTMSRLFGTFRNHLAVWITSLAVPVFWAVRFAETIVYPPLTWLIRLPRYESGNWVNISRQKFSGLVGYDLIWCLYCDWMTGVWSLGTEMLRNVESFWCPIRFYDDKKCENCKQDFPDIDNGWVQTDQGIQEVTDTLENKYQDVRDASWFGHPDRKE